MMLPAMRQIKHWAIANGGAPSLVVVGLGLLTLSLIAGVAVMVVGIIWFILGLDAVKRRLPFWAVVGGGLSRAVQIEIVATIQDGLALKPDVFTPLRYASYALWAEKTEEFLKTVLGGAVAQRFGEQRGPDENRLTRQLAVLQVLRDDPESNTIQVGRKGLEAAAAKRRHFTEAERIVIAEAPPALPYRNDRLELATEIRGLVGDLLAMIRQTRQEEGDQDKLAQLYYSLAFRDRALELFARAHEEHVVGAGVRQSIARPDDLNDVVRNLEHVAQRLERP
jgi:hypothetical protein